MKSPKNGVFVLISAVDILALQIEFHPIIRVNISGIKPAWKTKGEEKMKLKTAIFVIIVFLWSNSKIFAGTEINFSPDISGEFPSAAIYDNFSTKVTSAFKDAIKLQHSINSTTYLMCLSQINELTDKFTFGANSTSLWLHEAKGTSLPVDELKYKNGEAPFKIGIFAYFGFPVHKDISLFFNIGMNFTGIPVGTTVLWKFYQRDDEDLKYKFYLSGSILFDFINISTSRDRTSYSAYPLEGSYDVNGINEKLRIWEANPTYSKQFVFTLDLSLKSTISYKWFNGHAVVGLAIQPANFKANYTCNTNVDYVGSGSPTGVNSTLFVNFHEKWIAFLPHFDIHISFNITKWLRFPVLGASFVYNSIDGRLYFGFNMGMVLMF